MAYSSIGNPRFYINDSHFMIANGAGNVQPVNAEPGSSHDEWDNGVAMLNVGKDYKTTAYGDGAYQNQERIDFPVSGNYNFCFILGHNMAAVNSSYFLWDTGASEPIDATSGVNFSPAGYNGWTLHIFDGDDEQEPNEGKALFHTAGGSATGITKIKSVCIGKYYDMPHSPDLNLTMTREYGGIKNTETKSGASLSNDFGSSPPKWGNLAAWELIGATAPTNQELSRSGRRVWDLSFSYLDSGDVFGSNQLISRSRQDLTDGVDDADTGGFLNSGNFEYNILSDDNFYSQVIHKTNGGQLPFIFQPDSSNSNIDSFAICKFDQKSFSFQQTAPGLYSVKMKIREVW